MWTWVSPKGDTKPAKPRYNKGGIGIVKSTESLNSWYRFVLHLLLSLSLSLLRSSTWILSSAIPSCTHTPENYHRVRWRIPSFSLFLLAPGRVCTTITASAFACVSLLAGNLERPFSREESLSCWIPLGSKETRHDECEGTSYCEVWILTECARWNCAAPIIFSLFFLFIYLFLLYPERRFVICGIWGSLFFFFFFLCIQRVIILGNIWVAECYYTRVRVYLRVEYWWTNIICNVTFVKLLHMYLLEKKRRKRKSTLSMMIFNFERNVLYNASKLSQQAYFVEN